jgi:hypothetical protein
MNTPINPLTTASKKPAPKAFDIGGTGKGTNWRGLMFSIKLKTGDCAAFPYAYLQRIDWDPSKGLTLHLTSELITIEGRYLEELYYALLDHLVREITEADADYQTAPEKEAFIEQIIFATATDNAE